MANWFYTKVDKEAIDDFEVFLKILHRNINSDKSACFKAYEMNGCGLLEKEYYLFETSNYIRDHINTSFPIERCSEPDVKTLEIMQF
jgi:hypothetical protein